MIRATSITHLASEGVRCSRCPARLNGPREGLAVCLDCTRVLKFERTMIQYKIDLLAVPEEELDILATLTQKSRTRFLRTLGSKYPMAA